MTIHFATENISTALLAAKIMRHNRINENVSPTHMEQFNQGCDEPDRIASLPLSPEPGKPRRLYPLEGLAIYPAALALVSYYLAPFLTNFLLVICGILLVIPAVAAMRMNYMRRGLRDSLGRYDVELAAIILLGFILGVFNAWKMLP
jgi:hypothetical protein